VSTNPDLPQISRRAVGSARALCLALIHSVQVIGSPHGEDSNHLMDHLYWVGDAAGPEGTPEGIDFAAEFADEHVSSLIEKQVELAIRHASFVGTQA